MENYTLPKESGINPLVKGYSYWHTLKHFEALIKNALEEIKTQSEGFDSISEEDLFYMINPILEEMMHFVVYLQVLMDEKNESKDEKE